MTKEEVIAFLTEQRDLRLFGQQRGTTHWMTFVKFELTGNGG